MRYLTKTRFKSAIECVSKLRYLDDIEYDNAKSHNDFMIALAEGGHQVGALATTLFPEGVEVTAGGHDEQVAITLDLLKRDDVAIFEASVRSGRFFIRIDLLHRQGNTLRMYEVKAKSYDSRPDGSKLVGAKGQILTEFKPYLYDVAFQRHVLREAFPGMQVESYLVMPDKSTHTTQRRLQQKLPLTKNGARVRVSVDAVLADGKAASEILHTLPVDILLDVLVADPILVSGKNMSFADAINTFVTALDEPPAALPSPECRRCEFRSMHLASDLKDGRLECWSSHFKTSTRELSATVFDLYSLPAKRTDAVIASGRVKLTELVEADLELKEEAGKISQPHRQWLQCLEAQGMLLEPFIRKPELISKLADLKYPLHFIDFETARSPLPFQTAQRPYELVLFQFSHHVITADGEMTHATQYLNVGTEESPSVSSIRALKAALSDDAGTVLHWWDYERTVLGEMHKLIERMPESDVPDRAELLAFIESLVQGGRLMDLGRKVVHETVFMPGTMGSSSIKQFVPAMLNFAHGVSAKYSQPIYGVSVSSKNFKDQVWVQTDKQGRVRDPYELHGARFEDPDLAKSELNDEDSAISNGGAAMIAYGLLQSGALDEASSERLKAQLLRYCELDTFAMVLAWEGLRELAR